MNPPRIPTPPPRHAGRARVPSSSEPCSELRVRTEREYQRIGTFVSYCTTRAPAKVQGDDTMHHMSMYGAGKGANQGFVPQTKYDSVFWVAVERIEPNPYQPRIEFDEERLKALAESIRQYGVLQPLVVTRKELEKAEGGLQASSSFILSDCSPARITTGTSLSPASFEARRRRSPAISS